MRLLRLRIDGFGSLRGDYTFDPQRVTVVVDENERGKTSLLHAVVAALYGLDRDSRRYRAMFTPVERWRPWDGGAFGVQLEIECDGECYTVARDFAANTVQVLNTRGQDVTPDFLVEKGEYLVGQQLLGLDAEEFAKCAFWRQGELADVVPDLERERRQSTMQARLESAADTRGGDASAIEAIQTLDAALARYTSPELATTITIDNTLRRLDGIRLTLESEIQSLEHDYRGIAGPLEELARLDDEERGLRHDIRTHDTWRVKLRADDAQRRLDRDSVRREAASRLREEAGELDTSAGVDRDAQQQLATFAERHDVQYRRLEALLERRSALELESQRLEEVLATYADAEGATLAHADELAGRARELRRIDEEDLLLRDALALALEAIRAQGLDPALADELLPRFDGLSAVHSELLRAQPRIALAQQAEVAAAEDARMTGRTALVEIGRWKRPRLLMGAVAIVLGFTLAAMAASVVFTLLRGVLLAAGAVSLLGGAALVVTTVLARGRQTEAAHERIAAADERLKLAQMRATENESRLQAAATELGYPTVAALLEGWGTMQRLRELYGPVQALQQQNASLERRRAELLEGTEHLVPRDGEESPPPEALERAAERIRRRIELEHGRAELALRARRLDEEIQELERGVAAAERSAAAAIESAGITYEAGASWSAWMHEVDRQIRRAERRRELVEQQIPALEAEFLDDRTLEALRAEFEQAEQRAMTLDEAQLEAMSSIPTVADVESRLAELRGRLDDVTARRERLIRAVQGTADRYHAEHPLRCERLASVEREQIRAERFRDAVSLARGTIERVARETHRRWAEFLNERATDMLVGLGSSITRVRFGEDLDFAVTFSNGQQAARGRAIHQLSTGARDQLHLAVRLAISEYLSRGRESLPLLIDDCFATSDDERARHGMALLLDSFSRAHQVIFVTCHRQRIEAMAAHDPGLYASRVHWMELRPLVAASV